MWQKDSKGDWDIHKAWELEKRIGEEARKECCWRVELGVVGTRIVVAATSRSAGSTSRSKDSNSLLLLLLLGSSEAALEVSELIVVGNQSCWRDLELLGQVKKAVGSQQSRQEAGIPLEKKKKKG